MINSRSSWMCVHLVCRLSDMICILFFFLKQLLCQHAWYVYMQLIFFSIFEHSMQFLNIQYFDAKYLIEPNSKTQDRVYSFKIRLFLKLNQTKMLLNPFWSLTKMFSNRAMTLWHNVRFTPCNMSAIVSDSVTEQKTIFGQSFTYFAGGQKKKAVRGRPVSLRTLLHPPSASGETGVEGKQEGGVMKTFSFSLKKKTKKNIPISIHNWTFYLSK